MNTTELKALAEKATQGDMQATGNGVHKGIRCVLTTHMEPFEQRVDDAAYYAAANPAAILELIAAHEDAQGEIRALRATEQALREMVKALEFGLSEVATLMDESEGVAGLHLNGDVAPWSELRSGGRFEAWLLGFDEARALLEQKP